MFASPFVNSLACDPRPSTEAWKIQVVAAVLHSGLEVLLHAVPLIEDPLEAEILGSDAAGVWWHPEEEYLPDGEEREQRVGRAFAAHLEELADADALAVLRVLQLGGSDAVSAHAEEAAIRLHDSGLPEPRWWALAPQLRCTRAAELVATEDELAPMVCLELARADRTWTLGAKLRIGEPETIANIGIFPGLEELQQILDAADVEAPLPPLQPLDVPTAHRRIADALAATHCPDDDGGLLDPNVIALRGLAQRWLAVAGAAVPRKSRAGRHRGAR